MKSLTPTSSPFGSESDLDNYLELFDPAPLPAGDGARKISNLLEEHADWLQAAPRSSLSIVFHLFPGSVRGMKSASEMIRLISDYLWYACYTHDGSDTYNPTWKWQGRNLSLNPEQF